MQLKILLAALLISWLFMVGCDNDHPPDPPPPEVGDVLIIAQEDTIRFLPGDSASTEVTVIVSDQYSNVMEGVKVNISISDPELGFLEFLDPELRDTTNALGRVELLLTFIGTAGDFIITAEAGSISATYLIAIRESGGFPSSLELIVWPHEFIAASGDTVSAWVKVVLSDISGVAVVGTVIPLSVEQGHLDPPHPATNDSGIARTVWTLKAEQGNHSMSAEWGSLTRTVFVHIDIADSSQSD